MKMEEAREKAHWWNTHQRHRWIMRLLALFGADIGPRSPVDILSHTWGMQPKDLDTTTTTTPK